MVLSFSFNFTSALGDIGHTAAGEDAKPGEGSADRGIFDRVQLLKQLVRILDLKRQKDFRSYEFARFSKMEEKTNSQIGVLSL